MRRDPRSDVPDVGNGLWDRIAAATQDCLGADQVLWNGRLDFLTPQDEVENRAMARSDGTVQLHRMQVVGVMQAVHDRGPAVLDNPGAASSAWHAINDLAHEFGHLAGPEGTTIRDLARTWQPAYVPIEEAFNEAATGVVVSEVARRALGPEFAGRIEQAQRTHPQLFHSRYPGWTAGAKAFAAEIGGRTGVEPAKLLLSSARVGASDKGKVLAAIIVDSSDLPQQLRDRGQGWKVAVLKGQIENTINREFRKLSSVPSATLSPEVIAAGQAIGRQASADVVELLDKAERELPAAQPPAQQTQAVRQTGHAADTSWASVRFQPGELDRLRRMTSGQASDPAMPQQGRTVPAQPADSGERTPQASQRPGRRGRPEIGD